jgi:hydrocephalus-inducing protein
LFQDNIFKIEPLVGEIWPNSEITITVTFMPTQANTYDCMAFCNISCAEERLPLKLKGEGLGPKAYLTQQEINFGDIFVNQPIKQPIQIENRGEIQCHFTLEKPERAFAKMFEFSV